MSGKAISTRIYPPGDRTEARLRAFDCDGNEVVLTYGQADLLGLSLYEEKAARHAARQLCRKMGWRGRLVAGWTKAGLVFLFRT